MHRRSTRSSGDPTWTGAARMMRRVTCAWMMSLPISKLLFLRRPRPIALSLARGVFLYLELPLQLGRELGSPEPDSPGWVVPDDGAVLVDHVDGVPIPADPGRVPLGVLVDAV